MDKPDVGDKYNWTLIEEPNGTSNAASEVWEEENLFVGTTSVGEKYNWTLIEESNGCEAKFSTE